VRSFEKSHLRRFVLEHFHEGWADEAEAGLASSPATTLMATVPGETGSKIVGFASYDCTAKAFFGPTGVDPAFRGRGIGTALLLATLHAQHAAGYGYAVIGDAGPTRFYQDACGAIIIEGSEPGIYTDMLSSAK
jgi:GNAT superfamily N-acetyltransferase